MVERSEKIPTEREERERLAGANARFAAGFSLQRLGPVPTRGLVVVTCMDTRLNIERALGIVSGEAHILRNAGGIVTDDMLRSLVVSHHLLGTQNVLVVNHTRCGLMKVSDAQIQELASERSGHPIGERHRFYVFTDVEENVRRQVAAVKAHPWLAKQVDVWGAIYDVDDGTLRFL